MLLTGPPPSYLQEVALFLAVFPLSTSITPEICLYYDISSVVDLLILAWVGPRRGLRTVHSCSIGTQSKSLTLRLYFLIASQTLLSCISLASVIVFLAIYILSAGCFFSNAYVMLCVSGTPPWPCRLSLFVLLSDKSNPKLFFFSASHFSKVALCSYS